MNIKKIKPKEENMVKVTKNIAIIADGEVWQKTLAYRMSKYEGIDETIAMYKKGYMTGDCGVTDDERIMITPIPCFMDWQEHQFHLMNISDFSDTNIYKLLHPSELVESSVTMFSALLGVSKEAQKVWRERVEMNIPTLVFLTQMKKKEADFEMLLEQMRSELGANPLLLHLPIIDGVESFEGVIDLIGMRELIWGEWTESEPFGNYKVKERPVRDELLPQAKAYRQKMLEQIFQVERETKDVGEDELREAIREATLSMRLTPVLLGCVSELNGVQLLLDAIVDYLPSYCDIISPTDDSNMPTIVEPEEKGALVGVVVGTNLDPFVGELTAIRLFHGSIKSKSMLYNTTQSREESVDRMFKHYIVKKEEINELFAGETAYLTGLKDAKVGDVICDREGRVRIRQKNIRNIGIIAESKEDKIVLIEKMAFYMNAEQSNNSPWEWMRCERDMDIVIETPVTTESWREREINMINVPSLKELDSFSTTIKVLEGSVTHLSAVGGLSPLMVELWRRGVEDNVSSVIFVGKIAKKGADFFALVQDIQDRLATQPLLIQLPINQEEGFEGVVDLVTMKELIWEKFSDEYFEYRANNPKIEEIRPELREQATLYHQKMLEQIAEVDGNENLMEKFLEDDEITTEEIIQAIRVATISMAVAPVLMGCLSLNMGVRELLDATVDYLPSPLDVAFKKAKELESGREITVEPREAEPFVGLVTAIISDPYVGRLVAVRIYRGSLNVRKNGMIVHNSTKDTKERVGRIVKHKGISREEVGELFTGDIGYLVGLKKVQIGDTLCDPMHRVIIKPIPNFDAHFMVRFLIRDNIEEHSKLILNRLMLDNPSCRVLYGKYFDDAMLLYGKSIAQLNYLIDKLQGDFKLDIISDKPKVAHYYTIKRVIEKEYIYEQHYKHGKREQFAHLSIKLEPQERGAGYRFVDETKGGIVPKEFIVSINQGIQEALHEGIGDGYPMVDIKATLYDGSYDEVHSNEEVFRLAGYRVTKELLQEAESVMLEPIMKLNIEVAEKFRGAILADISRRRGIACGRGGDANNLGDIYVPLVEIVDYDSELNELTDGQASFEVKFERYEIVPEYLM